MTTGRINQITSLAGDPRGPGRPEAGDDPPGRPNPRRGRISLNGWGHEGARPAWHPPAYRGDTSGHPIAPSRLLSAGPHAEIPTTARTGRDGLRHTALGRGARPPPTPANGVLRRAASPGMLPKDGSAGQRPRVHRLRHCRDPEIPGLQRPRRPTPQGRHVAT
ncbi:hypothetical protein POX_u09936 [Penicillium oxalicum]|nr:hypothetical protein POX_u09936 [Penicillium oxalicum]